MQETIKIEQSVDPLMSRGFNFHEAGNNLAAAKIFEVAYRRAPSVLTAALNMGSAYFKASHYPEAEEAYKEVLRKDSENADAHYGLAMINEEIGDRSSAQKYFRKAAKLNPSSAKMWMSLAEVTCQEGERGKAISHAVQAAKNELKSSNLQASSYIKLGDIFFKAGLFLDAQHTFEQAVPLLPTSSSARRSLSLSYYMQQKFSAAADTNRDIILKCRIKKHWPKESEKFVQAAQKSIIAVHNTLSEENIPFFLIAGTLLGCIRDQTPLAHDRDVDIGILKNVSNKEIIEALRTNNDFSVPLYYTQEQMYLTVEYKGTPIDIFRHEVKEDYIWCGISRDPRDMKWRYTPFNLKKIKVLGLWLHAPNQPEKYLYENYGDWKKPDKSYSSVLSSPARYDIDQEVLRYFSHSRLLFAAYKKDIDLLNSVVAQTPEAIKNDTEIIERITEICKT